MLQYYFSLASMPKTFSRLQVEIEGVVQYRVSRNSFFI